MPIIQLPGRASTTESLRKSENYNVWSCSILLNRNKHKGKKNVNGECNHNRISLGERELSASANDWLCLILLYTAYHKLYCLAPIQLVVYNCRHHVQHELMSCCARYCCKIYYYAPTSKWLCTILISCLASTKHRPDALCWNEAPP